MFEKFFYFAGTFAEAGLALFGINHVFEQPRYIVRQDLGQHLEIRDYPPAAAVETTAGGATRNQASDTAFRLLFAYIAGENAGSQTIAMTAPVQQKPALIAMTAPVRVDTTANGEMVMRFFLPAKQAADPPKPNDPRVRVVMTPAATVAALRYSGNPTDAARAMHEKELLTRLAATSWRPAGAPYFLGYDPPFAIPFVKRNEVVVEVTAGSR